MDVRSRQETASFAPAVSDAADLLRSAISEGQPQEASPASTCTDGELQENQGLIHLRPRADQSDSTDLSENPKNNNLLDVGEVTEPCGSGPVTVTPATITIMGPQNPPFHDAAVALDWHGAPQFVPSKVQSPRQFRDLVRQGGFTLPTNAMCPGFLQCNLVVLPQGPLAFDFLLFCQRNPKACPLLEVCDTGSPVPVALAPHADLRTDCPKYAIYRHGTLEKEVHDVTNVWPENSVAFLIGCSFSYDGALMDAGIPLRSVEQGKNVPMYRTNLKCRPAGSLKGNLVVSMKPIPAMKIARHVEITSKYPHAHGGPVCIGRPECIGVSLDQPPDWGDAVELHPEDVPVFHACGVTPQSVLMDSKVPFAITHAAGHMFVTDMPSDMGGL